MAEWTGFFTCTEVTRGWNGYSEIRVTEHRKLTLEKKILPSLLQGLDWFEPATFPAITSGLAALWPQVSMWLCTMKWRGMAHGKLQALVYDILPSTTAVFSYVIGSRKLSANEQFFVGAQTVVSLLQTIQIKQGVSFIAANKVDTSTNKTTIVWIETELSFSTRGGCVSRLRGCLGVRLLPQSYQYPNLSWWRWPRRWTAARR